MVCSPSRRLACRALIGRRLSEASAQQSLLSARFESLLLSRPIASPARLKALEDSFSFAVQQEQLLASTRRSLAAYEAALDEHDRAKLTPPLNLLPAELLGDIAARAGRASRQACRALLGAHDTNVARLAYKWGQAGAVDALVAMDALMVADELAPSLIVRCTKLASLSVCMGPCGLPQLRAAAARGGGQLRHLDLQAEKIGAQGVAAPALAQLTSLTSLELRLSRRTEEGTARAIAAELSSLRGLSKIVLSMTRDPLDSTPIPAMPPLVRALSTLPSLRVLNVCNLLGVETCLAPCALVQLSMFGCSPSVPVLAPVLGRMTNLQRLAVVDFSTGAVPFDAAALAAPLAGLPALAFVGLTVDDSGAVDLASVLPTLARLEKLVVVGRNLGVVGVTSLASAASHHGSMRELCLQDELPPAAQMVIKGVMRGRCELTVMRGGGRTVRADPLHNLI